MEVTQRNNNRSQSTADYEFKKIFIFDNRYSQDVITNNSDPAATWTVKAGQLVYRAADGTLSLEGVPSSIVGICAIDGDVELAAAGQLVVNYCTKGTVDGNKLIDVAGDALDLYEVITGLALIDYIENMGIHVDTSSVEHTNFDN